MQNWILIKKYVCAVQTTLITRTIARTFSFQNVVGHWVWNLTFVQITAKNCLPSTFRLLFFFSALGWHNQLPIESGRFRMCCSLLVSLDEFWIPKQQWSNSCFLQVGKARDKACLDLQRRQTLWVYILSFQVHPNSTWILWDPIDFCFDPSTMCQTLKQVAEKNGRTNAT